MSTFDQRLTNAMSGIYVDSSGRTRIKDSHIGNIMTHKVKDLLDRLLEHGNIKMTNTNPITLQWSQKGKLFHEIISWEEV